MEKKSFVNRSGQFLKKRVRTFLDSASANTLIGKLKQQKKDPARKIRVGFIAQMPEVWNKNAAVFEAMLADNRFDPFLLAVPSFDLKKNALNPYGPELAFFKEKYPAERILTCETLGKDFENISEQGFDYLIYQRCWEMYLPKALHARSVLRHTKTIYIPYCFDLIHEPKSYYEISFFRYTYLTFASSAAQRDQMIRYGVRRIVFEGYPSVEESVKMAEERRSPGQKTVLWTPRWTEADFYGGTSFYAFREDFLQFKKDHPEIRCTFRPHPLLYENTVREKKMTEEELSTLMKAYEEAGIIIDRNPDVNDTLLETDVLLTDFSSIIMNAFMYRLPILYLKSLPEAATYEPFTSVTTTLYYPKTWAETCSLTERLLSGDDPKNGERAAVLGRICEEYAGSAERILTYLDKDYRA